MEQDHTEELQKRTRDVSRMLKRQGYAISVFPNFDLLLSTSNRAPSNSRLLMANRLLIFALFAFVSAFFLLMKYHILLALWVGVFSFLWAQRLVLSLAPKPTSPAIHLRTDSIDLLQGEESILRLSHEHIDEIVLDISRDQAPFEGRIVLKYEGEEQLAFLPLTADYKAYLEDDLQTFASYLKLKLFDDPD
ncbi:MAG: hypothetical protein AAFV95_01275 [Bacteroidota bacterium]